MVLAVRAALIVLVTWGDMEDNTQASILQLLRQQQQANEVLQNKDIKQAILIAGFIADTKFIDFVDESGVRQLVSGIVCWAIPLFTWRAE